MQIDFLLRIIDNKLFMFINAFFQNQFFAGSPQREQLERRDVVASQTLRAALTKAEQAHPGLSYDIVMGILKKGDLNVNLNESILRLQGGASETDCK